MNATQLIEQFLQWMYSPETVQADTLEGIFARIIVAEVITAVLAYLLRKHRPGDTIQQLPEDVVTLMMEGRYGLAYLLLTAYTLFEEALFFGAPIWLLQQFNLEEYKATAEYLASQLWALLHIYPGIAIPLIPMAVLKATLWLIGYWWISTLWHIAHNTIAYIQLVKQI